MFARRAPFAAAVALALCSSVDLTSASRAGDQNAPDGRLRVGAARIDITPPAPEGNTIRDRLYASAIVLDNGATRSVLIGADQIAFSEAAWTDVTTRLASEFKIPPAYVLTTATHTHSDGRFGVAPPPGTTAIGSVNAEIYTGIGTRIKARSPLAHTMVTALANGSAGSGYIPTEEAFNRHTFQVLGSRLKPGCAEDGIVTAALELLSEAVR